MLSRPVYHILYADDCAQRTTLGQGVVGYSTLQKNLTSNGRRRLHGIGATRRGVPMVINNEGVYAKCWISWSSFSTSGCSVGV